MARLTRPLWRKWAGSCTRLTQVNDRSPVLSDHLLRCHETSISDRHDIRPRVSARSGTSDSGRVDGAREPRAATAMNSLGLRDLVLPRRSKNIFGNSLI